LVVAESGRRLLTTASELAWEALGCWFSLLFLEESFWELPKKSIDLTAYKRYFHEGRENDTYFCVPFLEHFPTCTVGRNLSPGVG
jgi:hypothetical protein